MKVKRFITALTGVVKSTVCIICYRNGLKWQKLSAFFETMPQLRQLPAIVLLQKLEFQSRAVHIRFVGNKVAVDSLFPRMSQFCSKLLFHLALLTLITLFLYNFTWLFYNTTLKMSGAGRNM
jgi:hypothetical protein